MGQVRDQEAPPAAGVLSQVHSACGRDLPAISREFVIHRKCYPCLATSRERIWSADPYIRRPWSGEEAPKVRYRARARPAGRVEGLWRDQSSMVPIFSNGRHHERWRGSRHQVKACAPLSGRYTLSQFPETTRLLRRTGARFERLQDSSTQYCCQPMAQRNGRLRQFISYIRYSI